MSLYRTDFECEDLGNGIYRINEYDFVNSFLVIGEKEAAVIDCGAGVGQLHDFIRTLTDKPLKVLVTHSHADHDGGAVWFDDIYVHPNEFRRCNMDRQAWARFYFLHQHEYKRKSHHVSYFSVFQKDRKTQVHALNEGDRFDLGGREIEVFFTPGHTIGHLTLRDSLTKALFTGDNVNPLVTLQFPGGCTVEEWKESALRTLELAGDAVIYGGHGKGVIPKEVIVASLALADRVLAQENSPKGTVAKLRGEEKLPCIVYRTDRIHK